MKVFDSKDGIVFEAITIKNSYLVNLSISEKNLVYAFSHSIPHKHASFT